MTPRYHPLPRLSTINGLGVCWGEGAEAPLSKEVPRVPVAAGPAKRPRGDSQRGGFKNAATAPSQTSLEKNLIFQTKFKKSPSPRCFAVFLGWMFSLSICREGLTPSSRQHRRVPGGTRGFSLSPRAKPPSSPRAEEAKRSLGGTKWLWVFGACLTGPVGQRSTHPSQGTPRPPPTSSQKPPVLLQSLQNLPPSAKAGDQQDLVSRVTPHPGSWGRGTQPPPSSAPQTRAPPEPGLAALQEPRARFCRGGSQRRRELLKWKPWRLRTAVPGVS